MSPLSERREPDWISARHLQHFVARGIAAGLTPDQLLQDAGIARGRIEDGEGLIPVSAIEVMLESISRDHRLPLIGLHLANDIQPATFGPLGHIVQACRTFGDVLETIVRFNGLLSSIGVSSVHHAPGTVELAWECRAGGPLFRRQATEYVLGAMVILSRLLMPELRAFPQAVHLAHARHEDTGLSRAYFTFFRCPVHFDQPRSSILMPVEVLSVRMPHGDAQLKQLLEQHAQHLLQQRRIDASVADDVRHLLNNLIAGGSPSMDSVAQQLGMSVRSLHRKLETEGTSYGLLLGEVRMSLACEQLRSGDVPVSGIARRLGFASPQAFLRWFRQATGTTPSEFRKTLGTSQ
jgi:AraC-like DNA-binding protein